MGSLAGFFQANLFPFSPITEVAEVGKAKMQVQIAPFTFL